MDAAKATREAITGGEDYELLFAVSPRRRRAFMGAMSRCAPLTATKIGRLTAEPGTWLEWPGVAREPLPAGFAHFGHASGASRWLTVPTSDPAKPLLINYLQRSLTRVSCARFRCPFARRDCYSGVSLQTLSHAVALALPSSEVAGHRALRPGVHAPVPGDRVRLAQLRRWRHRSDGGAGSWRQGDLLGDGLLPGHHDGLGHQGSGRHGRQRSEGASDRLGHPGGRGRRGVPRYLHRARHGSGDPGPRAGPVHLELRRSGPVRPPAGHRHRPAGGAGTTARRRRATSPGASANSPNGR